MTRSPIIAGQPHPPDPMARFRSHVAGLLLALTVVLPCAAQNAAQPAENPEQAPADGETPPPTDVREAELPKFEELTLPTAETLLVAPPRDWIVLKNTDVVICEPLVPRPDTLAKRRAEIDAKMAERRGKSGEELEIIQAELEALNFLIVTLPEETENPEYALRINLIDRIMHHEDLVLQRIDALLAEGNLPTAFELLLRLERQWSSWPGAAERHNQLLFTDGSQRLANNDPESALVVLTDLRQRAPEFKGLSDAVAQAYGTLAERALAAGDNRAARHFLFRLDNLYPGHPVFQQQSAGMAQRANELLAGAEAAFRSGDYPQAVTRAEEAAVFWPRTPNLLPRFRPLADRFQRLRVGVVTLPPAEVGDPNAPDPAADRARRLLSVPIFEVERYRNGSAYYRTRYFEAWEPFDLGRRLLITLRQTRQPWETQPILDAPAFAAMLTPRLDPSSPEFDERLAGYVEAITVRSPVEVELQFHRVPARVEPILARLVPTDAPHVAPQPDAAPTSGGFVVVESDPDRVVFRRAAPEPDGLAQYHVAEVFERRYASHDKAVLGLRQGEVSMLVDLPDWVLRRVQVDPQLKDQLFIQQYALPTTHVLQINPDSPALRIRELRRALLHALDRDRILRQTVLRDPRAAHGRLVTSPFPSFSPANSLDPGRHSFDQSAALALVLAAAQQMDNQLPQLRMLVPNEPVARAAAEELVRDWQRVRIEVELVAAGTVTDDDDDWDLCYRTLQIAEPTVELWPFLAGAQSARIDDLSVFPDWLCMRRSGRKSVTCRCGKSTASSSCAAIFRAFRSVPCIATRGSNGGRCSPGTRRSNAALR
jgi:hypothetical protein